MTFTSFHSNRVEKLSGTLIAELTTHPLGNPLAQELVLVDNRVLGEWLNLQIAQEQGIAANIRYIQPHELFWLLARNIVSASIPRETPLSKEEMTWKLYGQLQDRTLLSAPHMKVVSDYLVDENNRDLKCYQLAASVADLFDQYMIYRPDWILKWQNRDIDNESEGNEDKNEKWQHTLFKSLLGNTQTNDWPHRAAIEKQLLKSLAREEKNSFLEVKNKIPFTRLSVFGITSMAPELVNLLVGLGRFINVHAYILNPCEEYWSLISSARELAKQEAGSQYAEDQHYEIGNPLLASQGVQVRDFISLLQNAGDLDPVALFDKESRPLTLLQSIQQEICSLQYKGESALSDYIMAGTKQPLPEEDGNTAGIIPSIHIHNCHSVMREVEVLHEQIRDILAHHPGMHTRDIVVMMPRVAPYVASIHAVFHTEDENERLAYHISDRTQGEESPLLISLLTLLKLPDSRLPLSEVLSLLEVPAIQRRFGIHDDAYPTIKRWLVDAGVRWGIDAAHRKTFGLPEYTEASWEFAFHRLFAGYAMTTDSDDQLADAIVALADGQQILPYDEVEGSNSAALDALLQFWLALLEWRNTLVQETTPHEWADRLRHLLDTFFEAEDDQEILAIKAARSCFNTLDKAEEYGWFTASLSLAVIRDLMQPSLEQATTGQNHWREGIKFCSLMPMRGVPFKVVFILGMNMEDYPRRIEKRSFDLMRNQHRAGDRASRIDDRWLFLEALLSARQYFHVSYIGRDIHRNEKCEPSVVLSELIDYCTYGYDLPPDYLITEHPLQPFSEKYFYKDKSALSSRLVSFDANAGRIASARREGNTRLINGEDRWTGLQSDNSPVKVTGNIVQLEDFSKFFTRPWDWFFTRKHKVWLEIDDENIKDEEDFGETDPLENWQLRKDLIAMVNTQVDDTVDREATRDVLVEQLATVRRAQGRWPLGKAGEMASENLKKLKIDYLWASYGQHIKPLAFSIAVGAGNNKIFITGELPVTADGKLILHSPGKLTQDKKLDFYIRLSILKQLSLDNKNLNSATACFFNGKSSPEIREVPLMNITEKNNAGFLQTLVNLYQVYRHSGLPFEPELGAELYLLDDADKRNKSIDEAWHEKSDWKTGIAYENKKRAYFGHIDAIKSGSFQTVANTLGTCIEMIDSAIKVKNSDE